MMHEPIMVINFKAYPTSYGRKGLEIAKLADKIFKEFKGNVEVIIAPPATEIRTLKDEVEVKIFAQHADPYDLGARTGWLPLEIIKDTGADGILINHSEHRLRLDEINKLVVKAKELNMISLVCADVPETGAAVALLRPDIIAVEPPELIGTGIAVSKAKPEVVTNSVNLIRNVNKEVIILTGAGISSPDDVEAAIRLGTSGVLVASAIMKAKDPEKVIRGMVEAAYKAWSKYR
ncbi:MAG: triose-phosphate isomerase [Desulfurococcales archaeon ex4484_42]|nr:MAG: triose-phosphate isomerase [Desulfurococcales archaeon ex4484_42]